jgi:large subunit ribosomal protein L4
VTAEKALRAPVFDLEGNPHGEMELPGEIFGREVSEGALHAAVRGYLTNQRQGTVKTKTRGEVKRTGKKPFRQKGTGRARQGTRRSPLFVGGGVTHGPQPRSHMERVPRKVRRAAILSALSDKASEGQVLGLQRPAQEAPRTRQVAGFLANRGMEEAKVLFLLGKRDRNFLLSTRNLKGARVRVAPEVSAYDLVWADSLVVTEDAVQACRRTWGAVKDEAAPAGGAGDGATESAEESAA